MIYTIIVASSENRVIGKDNKLPWKLPEDMSALKSYTMGKIVLMGRKTFESIRKPLSGRYNVVITSQAAEFNEKYKMDNLIFFRSFEEYFEFVPFLKKLPEKYNETCILGGSKIYEKSLDLGIVYKILWTIVHVKINGDAYFPEIDFQNWLLVKQNVKEKIDPNSYLIDDSEKKPLKYSTFYFIKD
jgi:dihydrofolate reductase